MFNHKRLVVAREERVKASEQSFVRAPVGLQRVLARGGLGGVEVSKNVRAPESVDCLLGIADEKQPVPAVAEEALENRVLQRVGVLKFVDQRRAVFRADGIRQHVAVCAVQRPVNEREQIVVGPHITVPFARGEFGVRIGEELMGDLVKVILRERAQGFAAVEERMRRRRLVLPRGGSQRGEAERIERLHEFLVRVFVEAVEHLQ